LESILGPLKSLKNRPQLTAVERVLLAALPRYSLATLPKILFCSVSWMDGFASRPPPHPPRPYSSLVCVHDFDLFDKTESPRSEMDAKFYSKTHFYLIIFSFFAAVSCCKIDADFKSVEKTAKS
jgi:hypothetical protein